MFHFTAEGWLFLVFPSAVVISLGIRVCTILSGNLLVRLVMSRIQSVFVEAGSTPIPDQAISVGHLLVRVEL